MYEVKDGTVGYHTDENGCHHAIILKVKNKVALALFFTGSSGWGRSKKKKRRATKSEIALAGFVVRKDTYLVPVVREKTEFRSNGITFPEDRVKELLEEFFSDP